MAIVLMISEYQNPNPAPHPDPHRLLHMRQNLQQMKTAKDSVKNEDFSTENCHRCSYFCSFSRINHSYFIRDSKEVVAVNVGQEGN